MDVLQSKDTVLGLDAYGVIYNDDGVFKDVVNVFEYCYQHGIDLFLMTNNVVQTMVEISNKLHGFGLSISPDRIISSGCGCYLYRMLSNYCMVNGYLFMDIRHLNIM